MSQNAPCIATRIRAVRRYLRMSGKQFAESLGTTKQKISLVENGKRAPSAELLFRIVDTHRIDARYLHGQIDEIVQQDESAPSLEAKDAKRAPVDDNVAQALPEITHELREIREAVAKIPGESGTQYLDPQKQSLLIQIISIALTSDTKQLTSLLEQMHSRRNDS